MPAPMTVNLVLPAGYPRELISGMLVELEAVHAKVDITFLPTATKTLIIGTDLAIIDPNLTELVSWTQWINQTLWT